MVDASERLQVLLSQEESIYKTTDYLARIHAQMQQPAVALGTVDPAVASAAQARSVSSSSPKKRKSSWDDEDNSGEQSSPPAGQQCASADDAAGTEGSSSTQINKHWREKICEWAYQVVDHFDLNREVVSIAMNHLDRFLDAYTGEVDKNLFQLLAMTCLYLSIKLNEYKHLLIPDSKSSMDTILRLSRGAFTLQQMEKMEYEVLQRLRWHVHPPTSQLFVKHFLFFLSVEENDVHDLTQFMIELSVMDYFFVPYKPSEVAVASLLNALERLYPQSTSNHAHLSFISQFLDINSPRVMACRERLALIYAQANEQGTGAESTPTKGNTTTSTEAQPSTLHRTTSPVSVMAAPQPYSESDYYISASSHDMEMEYFMVDDEAYDDL